MRNRTLLVVGNILVVLLFSTAFAFSKAAWAPDPPNRNVPGELIVGFHPQSGLTQIRAAISSIGGVIKGSLNLQNGRIVRVKLPFADLSAVDAAIGNLKSNPAFANEIMYVEPNMIRQGMQARGPSGDAGIMSQSNDPLLINQWGYYDIEANWINAPTTTTGVTVAVIDTGVDYTHPDLLGKVTKGYDFVNADTDPMDDMGHGTHVAGIIAAKANNNYGITGVSWNSKILAIKALDSSGYGNSYDISLAIIAAANNASVKVISMSLGGSYSLTEDLAVGYAVVTKGKLLVAAAGNGNTSIPSYPAGLSTTYPGMVLAVAAHDQAHCKASFSNYGTWVSVSAPGVGILSTIPPYLDSTNSGFASYDGTSMATPHVSGAAALAWQKYPTYTNTQIANLITTLAGTLTPLVRDGACWPIDSSTFQRLQVVHMLEQQFYESCNNKGGLFGNALDAETGLPLAGAKVTAKQGSTVTGIDYVPYVGQYTNPFYGDLFQDGFGLFDVLAVSGPSTLTIQKKKYMTFSPKDQSGLPVPVAVPICSGVNTGNIPVPPAKSLYWLAITWDYGYTGTTFDLYASVYDIGNTHLGDVFYVDPGELNDYPYTKLFWDSYPYWFYGITDVKAYAETIRISKITSGWRYLFVVDDATVPGSSSNWAASGIKAYLFKGNTLVKTFTPPPGTGTYWYICKIVGSAITDGNYLTDTWPTP
jgi:hypothetical protein